jgi:hypothetical protein
MLLYVAIHIQRPAQVGKESREGKDDSARPIAHSLARATHSICLSDSSSYHQIHQIVASFIIANWLTESYEYKSLLLQHECFKMEEADVELPKTIPARRSWSPEKE